MAVASAQQVDAAAVDGELNWRRLPEPELLLRFGDTPTYDGFEPWSLRLTEIVRPDCRLVEFDPTAFERCLASFARAEQRFGT